jgi:nucleotide-binding universal stress UspA family protein
MMMMKPIIPFILEIAGPLDTEVVLLRVLVPVPPVVVEGRRHVVVEDVEGRWREAEEYLAGVASRLMAKGIRVRTKIGRGDPASEILTAAGTTGADLIAMTTHGRTGPARLLFGSVAEAVLRRAEVPVLLMRQTEAEVERRRATLAVSGGR